MAIQQNHTAGIDQVLRDPQMRAFAARGAAREQQERSALISLIANHAKNRLARPTLEQLDLEGLVDVYAGLEPGQVVRANESIAGEQPPAMPGLIESAN